MKNTSYETHTVQLNKGDSLFLYSDAITESPSENKERLGTKGLQKIVEQHIKNPNTQTALRGIMNAFFEFAPPPPPDDVTAVLFKVEE